MTAVVWACSSLSFITSATTASSAARELMITQPTQDRVQSIADSYVAANFNGSNIKNAASIVESGRAVQVDLSADPKVFFPGPIGANAKRMTVTATAEVVGGGLAGMSCAVVLGTSRGSATPSIRARNVVVI